MAASVARTVGLCAKTCAEAAMNPAIKDISFFRNTITVVDAVTGKTYVLTCEEVK
jgi:hypothetical protein